MLPSPNSIGKLEGLPAADAWAPGVAAKDPFILLWLGGPTLERPGAPLTSNLFSLLLAASLTT